MLARNLDWGRVLGFLLILSIPKAGYAQPEPPRFLRIADGAESASDSTHFSGPLAGWQNARRDFRAQGDGIADDTDALQGAFDAIRNTESRPVLFIPAGTYRITRTLEVRRSGHADSKDIMILGEDPETTTLVWDGPAGGTMLQFAAWWAKLGRISFDGRGRARCALQHGTLFSSINELSDLWIRGVEIGIEAGSMAGGPVAETTVMRCRFQSCLTAAISIGNWNSLDWFIWDCHFNECRFGVVNIFGAGNFHVYRSVFNASTESDISIGNTSYFSVRDCISHRSRRFFTAGATGAPALLTLQGNRVRDTAEVPIWIGNAGPLFLIDNELRRDNGPAVHIEKAQARLISVGNTFSSLPSNTRPTQVTSCDDRVDNHSVVTNWLQAPQETPPRASSVVYELPARASRSQIQRTIDAAANNLLGHSIVHLPAGIYFIDKTLIVPQGKNISLLGDGGKTTLKWTGPDKGSLIRIEGPTRFELRDLRLHGSGTGRGVTMIGCDQEEARILLDQVDVRNFSFAGIVVRELLKARVEARSFYHSRAAVGVRVIGDPSQPPRGPNSMLVIQGGASADNTLCYEVSDAGSLLVQDIWYETKIPSLPRFMKCTGSGTFTLQGAMIAPQFSLSEQPSIIAENFQGSLSFLATSLNFPNTRLVIREPADGTRALLAGVLGEKAPELALNGSVAQLACALSDRTGGATPTQDRGSLSTAFLRDMLAQARAPKPTSTPRPQPDVAVIRLHRVFLESGESGLWIRP